MSRGEACDTCHIKKNVAYFLNTDSVKASIIFKTDTTYILRGERPQDRWISYGKWRQFGDSTIFFIPNKEGLQIKSEMKGRIWKLGNNITFVIKKESASIKCVKNKTIIMIGIYCFKRVHIRCKWKCKCNNTNGYEN